MAALTLFDAARDVPEDHEDDQRPDLEQSLKQKFEYLRAINDQNNKSAELAARELQMRSEMEQARLSAERLRAQQQATQDEVAAALTQQRNCVTEVREERHPAPPQVRKLLKCLDLPNEPYVKKSRGLDASYDSES